MNEFLFVKLPWFMKKVFPWILLGLIVPTIVVWFIWAYTGHDPTHGPPAPPIPPMEGPHR